MKKLMIGLILFTCLLSSCQKEERHKVLLVGSQINDNFYDLTYESCTIENHIIEQTFQLNLKFSVPFDKFYGASITFDHGSQRTKINPTEILINGIKYTELSHITYGTDQITLIIRYDISTYDISFDLVSDVSIGNQITISTHIPIE